MSQTLLCWHVGRRLLKENLQDGRGAYGKQILATVSQELTAEYGNGFVLRSLYRHIQFCQAFVNETIVSTLSTQLSWSHFMALPPLQVLQTRLHQAIEHAREQTSRLNAPDGDNA
jgi:hypothetical protein